MKVKVPERSLKTRQVKFFLTEEEHDRLREAAFRDRLSKSEWCRSAVLKTLKGNHFVKVPK